MAKEDLRKYRDLLLTDEEFQKKFAAAAEAYKGEQTEQAVFENVMLPLGKEYGLSATYDEFKEYTAAFAGGTSGELSEDELAQVAGGKDGIGLGTGKCMILGVGIGGGGAMSKSPNGWYFGTGLCLGIGAGIGDYSCSGSGESNEL